MSFNLTLQKFYVLLILLLSLSVLPILTFSFQDSVTEVTSIKSPSATFQRHTLDVDNSMDSLKTSLIAQLDSHEKILFSSRDEQGVIYNFTNKSTPNPQTYPTTNPASTGANTSTEDGAHPTTTYPLMCTNYFDKKVVYTFDSEFLNHYAVTSDDQVCKVQFFLPEGNLFLQVAYDGVGFAITDPTQISTINQLYTSLLDETQPLYRVQISPTSFNYVSDINFDPESCDSWEANTEVVFACGANVVATSANVPLEIHCQVQSLATPDLCDQILETLIVRKVRP